MICDPGVLESPARRNFTQASPDTFVAVGQVELVQLDGEEVWTFAPSELSQWLARQMARGASPDSDRGWSWSQVKLLARLHLAMES